MTSVAFYNKSAVTNEHSYEMITNPIFFPNLHFSRDDHLPSAKLECDDYV